MRRTNLPSRRNRRSLAGVLTLVVLLVAACDDGPTEPEQDEPRLCLAGMRSISPVVAVTDLTPSLAHVSTVPDPYCFGNGPGIIVPPRDSTIMRPMPAPVPLPNPGGD